MVTRTRIGIQRRDDDKGDDKGDVNVRVDNSGMDNNEDGGIRESGNQNEKNIDVNHDMDHNTKHTGRNAIVVGGGGKW